MAKMIKKLTIYLLLLMSLAACRDDIGYEPQPLVNGEVEFILRVPDMNVVGTRSVSEWDVSHLWMLVFNGSTLVDKEEFTDSDGGVLMDETNKTCTIKAFVKSGNKVYFIANAASEDFSDISSESDLKKVTMAAVSNSDLVMSGMISSISTSNSVALYRNTAKVTVKNGDTSYPFAVFGEASKTGVSIIAGANQNAPILGAPIKVTPSSITFPSSTSDPTYISPTENTGDNEKEAFIIMKAAYPEDGTTEYYYRLDFQNKDDSGEIVTLDINPNHYYEVIIKSVSGAGYKTLAEAAVKPSPMVDYIIHDHSPVVYNMVTDGIRELGVSHEVRKENNDDATFLYVKLYSKNEGEDEISDEDIAANIKIEENISWINGVDFVGMADGENGGSVTDNNGTNGAGDTSGHVYKFRVNYDTSTKDPGPFNEKLTVSWKGLSREVPVIWIRKFDGRSLCNAYLTIKNKAGTTQWGFDNIDYWNFLEGSDATRKIYGVSETANNGSARDAGLHFPLMYGEKSAHWTYEYKIVLDSDLVPNGNDTKWEVKVTNDDGSLFNLEFSPSSKTGVSSDDDRTFTIKRTVIVDDENDDYGYGTGIMTITVNGNPYTLNLYHTGFFHKSDDSHRVNVSDQPTTADAGYYYYEVWSDGKRHWLDRNLGAKSAEMYIRSSDGTTYVGNPDAQGGYYKVANYEAYTDPEIYDDLCPPGYTVPSRTDWDNLRKSSQFQTEALGNYFTARYLTNEGRYVYFPKGRYLNDKTWRGEDRAGYYWTSTRSSGLEKEQVGSWLQCITMSGNATSLINGQVENGYDQNGSMPGYAMAVRCIDNSSSTGDLKKTNFFVRGATHIYLYEEEEIEDENGDMKIVRNPTTTWPGHAVGNYESVLSDFFNFYYESRTFNPNNLKVIFNYVDKDKIIHTRCMNLAESGETETSILPDDAKGWDVITVLASMKDSGLKNPSPEEGWIPTDAPQLTYYWDWTHEGTSTKSFYCYSEIVRPTPAEPETITVKYRLWWQENPSNKYWRIRILDGDSGKQITDAGWNGGTSGGNYDGSYWYKFEFTITDTPENIDARNIIPEFGTEYSKIYRKEYNSGKIPLKREGSWFSKNGDVYEYGKPDGLTTGEVVDYSDWYSVESY